MVKNRNKIIIGLAGKIACGKGTVGDYLSRKHGAVKYGFSDALRKTLPIYDLSLTRENLQTLSKILRKNFSEDILAKAMVKKSQESKAQTIVVDGVRRLTDIANFQLLDNFHLIYIKASQKNRYDRYVKRSEAPGDDVMTFDEFKERDSAESEQQIESLENHSHFKVENNNSMSELYRKVDEILKQLQ